MENQENNILEETKKEIKENRKKAKPKISLLNEYNKKLQEEINNKSKKAILENQIKSLEKIKLTIDKELSILKSKLEKLN
ncbi:hypothetical protein [Campylobacter lari]|uniref:hypothetical protein n=1 Tax=Campylobacter lari TaxID=201 RepID=UPI001F091B42|nr:hypothetical protein [Campylobacter lari]MCH3700571.1 hypothetical protein [Campylobacter lari]